MKRFYLALVLPLAIFAKGTVVSGDGAYETIGNEKLQVIYSKEYPNLAQEVYKKESEVISKYSKSFGYEMDSPLYLGILSSQNQVSNAFSNQFPLNMQMEYGGGSMGVDYFSTKSWIDTLLYHESAHNFQLNPKKNILSRYAHKVFGNIPFSFILFPIFPVPNILENSFLLEGNAVLNESLHQNGGRLYSGAFKAMLLTQAKAGNITPQRLYNDHLFFPYNTHHYIVGGYFQYYMAKKYGLDRTNRYFLTHSSQWIPIFTNKAFRDSFGISFEEAVAEFRDSLKQDTKEFISTKGELIATSQSFVKLNKDNSEVLFLSSDARSLATLYQVSTKGIKKQKTTLKVGEVFRVGDRFYTLASSHTSPTKIEIALYDEDGEVLENSQGKAIWYKDGQNEVYFDIKSSFDEPKLYKNGSFVTVANSSPYVDRDKNIYYFKQNGTTRTLYKNRDNIFSYEGHYGFVCDVDSEGIYFIANSKLGSTLYRYDDGVIRYILDSDDIVDMKLLNKNEAVVEVMSSDGVEFRRVKLGNGRVERVHETKLALPIEPFATNFSTKDIVIKPKQYNPTSNLHFSGANHSLTVTDKEVNFDINVNFTDPLEQNRVDLFISKLSDETDIGVGYDNSEYRANYGLSLYGVVDDDKNSSRDFGAFAYISYPIYRSGYKSVSTKLSYSITSDRDEKAPLKLTLNALDKIVAGHSMYTNYLQSLTLSTALDRGDMLWGGEYRFKRELSGEFYFSTKIAGARSSAKSYKDHRGIKIDSYRVLSRDGISYEMPSLNSDIYVKSIVKGSLSLKKVFNFSKYYFTFPASLRRESIYTTYNLYNLESFKGNRDSFNEFIVGGTLDMLYFNSASIPISFEYIHSPDIDDSNNFRVLMEMNF